MKRGTSGLSFVVGVDKPSMMSSHDVVNRCRRLFGEKRVGHTGTLDPLATGVLPICVGPATRLSHYLTNHDKKYRVQIAFGAGTDTDDSQGSIIRTGKPADRLYDRTFASEFVSSLVGVHTQLPPAYSAIKVQGKKAYEAARVGAVIKMDPRTIEVYAAQLVSLFEDEETNQLIWEVDFSVSKGTYIRSLARDMGVELGCPAHVFALRRQEVGKLTLDNCVSLEALEEYGLRAVLDPVVLLDYPFIFLKDEQVTAVENGISLALEDFTLYCWKKSSALAEMCNCSSGVCEYGRALLPGDFVSVVHGNTMKALYSFDSSKNLLVPACVFQKGVLREHRA